LRELGNRLIVTAPVPPAELSIRLPDLKTRLGWGLTLRLQALNDDDKLIALGSYARSLGLDLPPQVGRFLLSHYRRDLSSLRRLLDDLDHATLAAKRKLTIPFLKNFLGETT
jgi:DnaA family protein